MPHIVFHQGQHLFRTSLLAWFALACSSAAENEPNAIVLGGGDGSRTASSASLSVALPAASSVSAGASSLRPLETSAPLFPQSSAAPKPSAAPSAMTPDGSSSQSSGMSAFPPGKYSNWTEVTEPPKGLTNCFENPSRAGEACAYLLDCDEQEVRSDCYHDEDGNWSCQCWGRLDDSSPLESYFGDISITGGDSPTACRNAASVCTGGTDNANSKCVTTPVVAPGYCELATSCEHELLFSDQTTAKTNSYEGISCDEIAGAGQCNCSNGSSFTLNGASTSEICSKGKEFCSIRLNQTGPEQCSEPIAASDASYCSIINQCYILTPGSDPKISASVITREAGVSCNRNGDSPAWYCDCQQEEGRYLSYGVDATGLGSPCQVAAEVCTDGFKLASQGEVACDVSTTSIETSGSESCSASALCFQEVDVAVASSKLGARLRTRCDKGKGSAFQCHCGDETTTIEVSASTSTTACEGALTACAKRSTLSLDDTGQPAFVFGASQ